MISGLTAALAASGAALLLQAAVPGQEPAGDPLVLLDDAKMLMADGKLEYALEELNGLEPAGVEPLVDQEIMFERLMLNAAFLEATHYLLEELAAGGMASSPYGSWLTQQNAGYAEAFAAATSRFLDMTAERMDLDFVRFRLPQVTDDYLEDAGLYADEQVLSAAVTNFDDGRDGLGRGVIVAQARIALVLFAAEFYDLPTPAATLEAAAERLRAGVPVDEAGLLKWLGTITGAVQGGNAELQQLAARISGRREQRGYLRLIRDAAGDGGDAESNSGAGEASE